MFRGGRALWIASLSWILGCGAPPPREGIDASASPEAAAADRPSGLTKSEPGASPGYLLYAPLLSDTTYLVDAEGLVVHTWKSRFSPQGSIHLLEDGRLLRGARVETEVFRGGGAGGLIEEFSWEGELVWSFPYASEDHITHHELEPLPNGNVLAIAWERNSAQEVRAAGRRPETTPEQGLWPDKVIEIEPTRPEGGAIVWEWRVWDHLVQDLDPSLPNFGDPAALPHRVDVNGGHPMRIRAEDLERLKALGYVSTGTSPGDWSADFLHTNAVAYNVQLDQIALSTPNYNEIWIIDHSTTTEEAGGSHGGRWGRGGDLLYRWGNASTYLADGKRRLFRQHDVHWIAEGLPGAGRLLIFNNNLPGPEGRQHSAVFEIEPPVDEEGRYVVPQRAPFGPAEPLWKYEDPERFFSDITSSAQRLENGNTFICQGRDGRFFEVTPEGDIVWEYWSPYSGNVRMADGSQPQPVQGFTYAVFNGVKIPPDHPALAGRDLKPLDPQPPAVRREEAGEAEQAR